MGSPRSMSRSTSPPTPPSTSSTTLPMGVATTPASSPPSPPSPLLTLPPLPSPQPKFLQPSQQNIIQPVPSSPPHNPYNNQKPQSSLGSNRGQHQLHLHLQLPLRKLIQFCANNSLDHAPCSAR